MSPAPGSREVAVDAPPLFLDGDQVVVVASHDRRVSCALRGDGYPLKLYGLTVAQQLHADALAR